MLRETTKRLPDADATKARVWIGDQFRASFGRGVNYSDPPKWVPTHDGKTELDISTLLTLLVPRRSSKPSRCRRQGAARTGPQYPTPHHRSASTSSTTSRATAATRPPLVMSQHLGALIGLRLFQLPLRTALATRTSSRPANGPPTCSERSRPTRFSSMSTSPARRVHPRTPWPGPAFSATCRPRSSSSGTGSTCFPCAPHPPSITSSPTTTPNRPSSSQISPAHADHTQVVAHLEYMLSLIARENADTDDEDTAAFLKAMAIDTRPAAQRLADVLVEALRKRGYENAVKWFWSTGGIRTDIGLLSGPPNVRRAWTYAPSDLLLASLLSVIFTRPGGGAPQAQMGIAEVLDQLNIRFGLCIDQPPAQLDTAENRAAASANLEAFKYRLQLLGAFDGLSDDFSAQRVRNPLIELSEEA